MSALKLLFSTYWQPILAITLCLSIVGYVGYQRHKINGLERDNALLQSTIDLTKAVGQAANEKAERIEQGAHAAAIASTTQYLSDLEKVKKYNANHPTVKYVTVNGVRQPTTDTSCSQMPTEASSAQGVDAGTTNQVSDRPGLEGECRITTLMLLRLQDFERDQQAIH